MIESLYNKTAVFRSDSIKQNPLYTNTTLKDILCLLSKCIVMLFYYDYICYGIVFQICSSDDLEVEDVTMSRLSVMEFLMEVTRRHQVWDML